MKNLLLILTLTIVLASCNNSTNCTSQTANPANDQPDHDHVEIIYFHGKQRCATCEAIENLAKELIYNTFSEEVENGSVTLKIIDITTPEGEKLADNYEVTWSSLFVNKWKDGKESRNNLTEYGFGNARKNPDGFKKGLADKIRQSLK